MMREVCVGNSKSVRALFVDFDGLNLIDRLKSRNCKKSYNGLSDFIAATGWSNATSVAGYVNDDFIFHLMQNRVGTKRLFVKHNGECAYSDIVEKINNNATEVYSNFHKF